MANINELDTKIRHLESLVRDLASASSQERTVTLANIKSIAIDKTMAEVTLLGNKQVVSATIAKDSNYWNLIGHLQPGDSVLVIVQNKTHDVQILDRIHDKQKDFIDTTSLQVPTGDNTNWGALMA